MSLWAFPHSNTACNPYYAIDMPRDSNVLASMAIMTIKIIKKIVYILLRLPFSVAKGPNDFCLISEPIIDLTNVILRDKTWSPQAIHSPLKARFKLP